MVADSGRIEAMPMLGAAAAPDIAIAVPTFSPSVMSSTSLVLTYPVASLPVNNRLNMKKSALRPRLLAKSDPGRLSAAFTRWYGERPGVISVNLKVSAPSSTSAPFGPSRLNRNALPRRSR